MADLSSLPPPILDPSQYPDWTDMQRKQQIAQMLQNSLQQSLNSPSPQAAPVGPYQVQAKRGMMQTLAPILTAALAGKAQNDAWQSQANYFNPKQPYQSAQYDANASAQAPDGIAAPAPGAGSPTNTPTTRPGLVPASQNPMIPNGMNPRQAQAMLNMMGPQEYAKLLTGPESVQLARWGGLNPQTAAAQAFYHQNTPEAVQLGTMAGLSPQAAAGRAFSKANDPDSVQLANAAGADPSQAASMALQKSVLPEPVWMAGFAGSDPAQAAQGAIDKANFVDAKPGSTYRLNGKLVTAPDVSRGEQYVTNPDGSISAKSIPGADNIMARRQGLSTAATQANTPREIQQGGGVTTQGFLTPPALGGGQNGQPRVSAPNAQAPGANPGAQPGAAAASPATPPLTGAWAKVPQMQIPQTPNQSSDAFTMGRLKNASDKDAELSTRYGQESDLADQKLQYNALAAKTLPKAEVGPLSEWLTDNRSKLKEWGVPDDLIPGSGTVTPTLELNKVLKNAAVQGARATYGTRMTQNEVKLQTDEMSPSPTMTKDAIASLLDQDSVKNLYAKQRAQDYQKFQGLKGDPQQFETWYSTNRPLTRFSAQAATQPAALQRLQQNPQLLADFKKQYGWDPTN